jgi:glycosyltransferase involved in cell wall biosynthesis
MKSVAATVRDVGRFRLRLRELGPDLVHTNSLKAAVYGGIAGRLEGIPVVWHIRDRIARDYLGTQATFAIRGLAMFIPNRIIFNSRATRETCRVPVSFKVIPSPVIYDSSAVFSPHDLTRSGRGMRFAMVGRLAPWKGQHVFLRAFSEAFFHGDEQAVIAGSAMFGEDEYAAELRLLAEELGIAERVTFPGFVDDIPALLEEVDALVHASVVAEPFGQVVIEGMASGLPVIATAAGGPLEIITSGRTGILVTPGDVGALAAQMRRLRDEPELCQRLGLAAYERARDFSAERVATSVLETWRATLAAR